MGSVENKKIAKPFLKWVGGKSQILKVLDSRFPIEIKKNNHINKYFEPFIGGGALFFHVMSHYDVDNAFISDTNSDLILTYNVIKRHHGELIQELDKLIADWPESHNSQKPIYEDIRKNFNKAKSSIDYADYSDQKSILQAARLIFLNKTCFNGIYRVNSKGEFNVPIGRYKKPSFYDEDNLKNVSHYLQKTEIFNESYDFFKKEINCDSFVYLDPPYRPITENGFTSYTKSNFNDDDQEKLADFYKLMTNKGAKIMLSNSDPHNRDKNDDFFDELYRGFSINRIRAKRFVNSDGNNRGPINEILVRNYNYSWLGNLG